MDLKDVDLCDFKLKNLAKINIIVGMNGCGKSTLLRSIYYAWPNRQDTPFRQNIRYLSPERGGELSYEPEYSRNMESDCLDFFNGRTVNHDQAFRQKSMSVLAQLELQVSRSILASKARRVDFEDNFISVLEKINSILDGIYLKLDAARSAPVIYGRSDNQPRIGSNISSGEKELITLVIEMLSFSYEINYSTKTGAFLLDEPDIHLHPDLQARLMSLMLDIFSSSDLLPETVASVR